MTRTGRRCPDAPVPGRAAVPHRFGWRVGLRRVGAVGLVAALALTASACVGKTGRNDDDVKPGSSGPSGRVVPHDG